MNANGKPFGVLGLTDAPRPPLVAKAKIGEQVPNSRGEGTHPVRLDYIIFVEPGTGRRLPEYQVVFGERPQSFTAVLPGDLLCDVADVAWKRYGTTGLQCRGDGERAVVKETGKEIACAGPYQRDNLYAHLCEHARPTKRPGNEDKAPVCKPVLSLRLVVPQIPGLGVVQLDTGGSASSIPTLMWQLQLIERQTDGHMAGIAVRVSIKAFPDKFGNPAYAWQLEPLPAEEARQLEYAALSRIQAQLPRVADLPAIEETTGDADLYGQGLEAVSEEPTGVDIPQPERHAVPPEWDAAVEDAEAAFGSALAVAGMPPAKTASYRALFAEKRALAESKGKWEAYVAWLSRQVDTFDAAGRESAGQASLV